MRDTASELANINKSIKPFKDTVTLLNSVLAMLTICLPILTISTVLWQWLG